MPVLSERRKLTKENLLILRPYILWKRRKEHLLEARLIAEIKQEEEKRVRDEEEKKRQAEERRKEKEKELQDELSKVKLERQTLEDKLKILQEQKHELFVKLKNALQQQETQRKQKYIKDLPGIGQMERSHMYFPGITTNTSIADITNKAADVLAANIDAPPAALLGLHPVTSTYFRTCQGIVAPELVLDQVGGASAVNRSPYGFYPHPRTPQPKAEHTRLWTSHLSPHSVRGHASPKLSQGRPYLQSTFSYTRGGTEQQQKTPSKHN